MSRPITDPAPFYLAWNVSIVTTGVLAIVAISHHPWLLLAGLVGTAANLYMMHRLHGFFVWLADTIRATRDLVE